MSILDDGSVREALRQAWEDSEPDTPNAHEEGGFVLLTPNGKFAVERWPRGAQQSICPPPFTRGKRNGLVILATLHTHPNSGPEYRQGPSRKDVKAVRDDPDLGHAEYEGEYVISLRLVYRIRHDGDVETVGETRALLGLR